MADGLRQRFGLAVFLVPLALAALTLPPPRLAVANGVTIQVASHVAGPYALTVFTSPSPIRVGEVDVSVLVQRAGSNDLVRDARVVVITEPVGHISQGGEFEATHEQATNKLYYAAHVRLPTEGRWSIEVAVSGQAGEGSVTFEVEAASASLLDSPLLLMALLVAPVVAVAWWLSRGRRRTQ